MSTYKDTDALVELIDHYILHDEDAEKNHSALFIEGMKDGYYRIRSNIINLPAADVKCIVRGEWEVHRFIPENSNSGVTYTRCSICGNLPMLNPYSKEEELTNFCPYCGADMRGE